MDEADLLARMDANYFRSWSLLTAGSAGHEVVEQDGLLLTSGASHSAAFNLAYFWVSRRPLAERIEEMQAYFERRKRFYLVRFRAGAVPGIEDALAAAGYERAGLADIPAMVLTARDLPGPNSELEIVGCRSDADLEAWAKTMSPGYGVSRELAASFTNPVRAGVIDYELYLGRIRSEPVATAGLVLTHGVAGIYLVSTLAPHRRRGHGEAMTWHAVRRGLELGARCASLQPSAMGRALYERMGFREVGAYRTYEARRWLV
jgi:ribosomal protein S18 acetylase RimI-like enzyme